MFQLESPLEGVNIVTVLLWRGDAQPVTASLGLPGTRRFGSNIYAGAWLTSVGVILECPTVLLQPWFDGSWVPTVNCVPPVPG
jgi:hypothetical protein